MSQTGLKISIVTIALNQVEFIEECIRSVIEQSYVDLEYIVIDPGSTDGTRDVLNKYADCISKIVHEPDDGPADGLNKGFSHATGDVLAYINADDLLVPGAPTFVAEWFSKHPEIDILCGAIRIIDRHGRSSLRKRTADRFDLANYAAGICTVGQQATFFRRTAFEAAGGFNAANRITWDGELLVDMALAGCRFATVNKILGEFRIYPNSITGSNKFLDKQKSEFERIRAKLEGCDIRLYGELESRIRRVLYKVNIGRHLGYLLVR